MNFNKIIESAEDHYQQILEEFFITVYGETTLSSHGLDHHMRVWKNSKELLNFVPLKTSHNISHFAEELIIASYLHDIGMSVDSGFKHGTYSKNLCIRFLNQNNMAETDFSDLLEAIENHDNKEYPENRDASDLLKILSIADDLDAFGFIGVFRYAEIYLTRKIEIEKLGFMVRENAARRFDNFVKTVVPQSDIAVTHHEKYNILDSFFARYNEHLSTYKFGTAKPAGYCGVIELFIRMINNKTDLKVFYNNSEEFMYDPVIQWYFSGLQNETKLFIQKTDKA